jgi:hypothetical protein
MSRGGRKRNLRRRLHDADLVFWPFIQFECPSRMFNRSRRQHPHTPNRPCGRSRRLAAKRMPRRSAPPCSNNGITDGATRVGRRVRGDQTVIPSRCVRELHVPGEQAPYPGRDRNVTPPTSEDAADTTSINSDRWTYARTAQWHAAALSQRVPTGAPARPAPRVPSRGLDGQAHRRPSVPRSLLQRRDVQPADHAARGANISTVVDNGVCCEPA